MTSSLNRMAAMAAFVLMWGSAAIFTRWALDHASVSAVLILRYALALVVLGLMPGRKWLPLRGIRLHVAGTGFVLVGCYSLLYFQAMAHGVTPGLLATMLGIQPILTLLLTERRFSFRRLAGLLLALGGLVLVVYESLIVARMSALGLSLALGALACTTVGAMMQKRIQEAPTEVLPLQYIVTLALYLAFAPFQPFHVEFTLDFLAPLLFLGLVISVAAQLLLYRLIRNGNLVDITSLFYLVPVVTVVLDYVVLGNAMPAQALMGMAGIVIGLAVVLSKNA